MGMICAITCKGDRSACAGVPVGYSPLASVSNGPPQLLRSSVAIASRRDSYATVHTHGLEQHAKLLFNVPKQQSRYCRILRTKLHHELRSLPIALPGIPTPTLDDPEAVLENHLLKCFWRVTPPRDL